MPLMSLKVTTTSNISRTMIPDHVDLGLDGRVDVTATNGVDAHEEDARRRPGPARAAD